MCNLQKIFVDIYCPRGGHSGITEHMKTRRIKFDEKVSGSTSEVSSYFKETS